MGAEVTPKSTHNSFLTINGIGRLTTIEVNPEYVPEVQVQISKPESNGAN